MTCMATDPSLEWSPTPAGGSQRTPASLCLALGILYPALLRVCVAWPLRCVSAWQGLLLPPLSCPPAFCGCQRRRTTPSSFPGIFFVIWLEKPAVPFSSLKAPSGPPTHWQRGRISPHPPPLGSKVPLRPALHFCLLARALAAVLDDHPPLPMHTVRPPISPSPSPYLSPGLDRKASSWRWHQRVACVLGWTLHTSGGQSKKDPRWTQGEGFWRCLRVTQFYFRFGSFLFENPCSRYL